MPSLTATYACASVRAGVRAACKHEWECACVLVCEHLATVKRRPRGTSLAPAWLSGLTGRGRKCALHSRQSEMAVGVSTGCPGDTHLLHVGKLVGLLRLTSGTLFSDDFSRRFMVTWLQQRKM